MVLRRHSSCTHAHVDVHVDARVVAHVDAHMSMHRYVSIRVDARVEGQAERDYDVYADAQMYGLVCLDMHSDICVGMARGS